jgi:CRP/FNR family transcriptional regulator
MCNYTFRVEKEYLRCTTLLIKEQNMIRKTLNQGVTHSILKQIPLFSKFSNQELSVLLERSSVYSYNKDEIIIMAEEKNTQMYVVLKGQVRVVKISVDGQERVMALRHSGGCFGDMGLLDGQTDSATVIANEPSKILLISKAVFDDFFLLNRVALLRVIETLCGRLRESWLFHSIIGNNDAESKIRATLAHYSKTLGIQDKTGVIINAYFSHQSIADRVHITRETVTRVLKKMKDQHEIEMVERHFKLLPPFFECYEQSELYRSLGMPAKKS